MNSFCPTLSHLARWFPKPRAWYRITLRDELYEPLVQFELMLDSARSATETSNFTPKCVTKSLEIAIFAHMLDWCSTYTVWKEFSGTPCVCSDLRMV